MWYKTFFKLMEYITFLRKMFFKINFFWDEKFYEENSYRKEDHSKTKIKTIKIERRRQFWKRKPLKNCLHKIKDWLIHKIQKRIQDFCFLS